jgi:hypothetical protein
MLLIIPIKLIITDGLTMLIYILRSLTVPDVSYRETNYHRTSQIFPFLLLQGMTYNDEALEINVPLSQLAISLQ